MGIELTPAAKELLAEMGYDPVLGARPLRRTIQREIEDVLSEKILYGELRPGQIVVVGRRGRGRERDVHLPGRGEVGSAGRSAGRVRGGRRAQPLQGGVDARSTEAARRAGPSRLWPVTQRRTAGSSRPRFGRRCAACPSRH